MCDELVKRLRDSEHEIDCSLCDRDCCYPDGKVHGKCIIIEAADAIEAMCEMVATAHCELANVIQSYEESKPRWIPVTEALPKEMDRSCGGWSAEIRPSDDVLVWLSSEKRQSVAWYSHAFNEWTTVDENTVYCFDEITHWQSLSEPPKEDS